MAVHFIYVNGEIISEEDYRSIKFDKLDKPKKDIFLGETNPKKQKRFGGPPIKLMSYQANRLANGRLLPIRQKGNYFVFDFEGDQRKIDKKEYKDNILRGITRPRKVDLWLAKVS